MIRISRRLLTAGAAIAVAATGLGVASLAGAASGNKYPTASRFVNCEGTDQSETSTAPTGSHHYLQFDGALKLWPPNHKYQPYALSFHHSKSDGSDSLSYNGTNTDVNGEGEELQGSGPPDDKVGPDVSPPTQTSTTDSSTDTAGNGVISEPFQIRSERSGQSIDGRTYNVATTASWTDSNSNQHTCQHTFQVVVPHDMRPSNR